MKILHICPTMTDGLSYQENYITKYHKRLNMDVTVITSKWIYNENGKMVLTDVDEYINEDAVKVIRLDIENGKPYSYKFKKYKNFFLTIEKEKPDIIFVHGCQWIYIKDIVNYKQLHYKTKLYVDNHADYSNSATSWISKRVLHGMVWKHYAKMLEPYTEKFYGVMPSRVDLLTKLYGVSKEKCELLVMGADDDYVVAGKQDKKEIRNLYNIAESDFFIVTGGKIDLAKRQTLLLMKAIKSLNLPNVKLLIFGSIVDELKIEFESLCTENIIYIGWIQSKETYKYIAAADLAVYPGRHSVLWEQTVAQGIPMVVKYWEGTTHIDIDGNVKFLYQDSVKEIQDTLMQILKGKEVYASMLEAARSERRNEFLYSEIAKRSIEWDQLKNAETLQTEAD